MRYENFQHFLDNALECHADRTVFFYDRNGLSSLTYREFSKRVHEEEEVWKRSRKTCLGLFADGSLDSIVTLFAANFAGLQIVMLDQTMGEENLRTIIPYADIDVLYPESYEEKYRAYLAKGVKDGKGKILFFTSGTTSRAKAVVLTDHSLMQSAYNGWSKLPLSEDDILLAMLPQAHVFGFVCGILWGLASHAAVALGRGMRHYFDDFSFYHPTAVSVVPALLGMLLKMNVLNEELSLILVGAGDCPDALLNKVKRRGLRLSYGYGLTETSSGVAISTGGDPRAMEVCPDDEILIAEDGEVLIKAPTCMMQGYYKFKEDTDAVLRDGLLYTGDLGELDEEGRLHLKGRKKDILVFTDGTKVYLPEYEAELSAALNDPEIAVITINDKAVLVRTVEEDKESVFRKIEDVQKKHPRSHQIRDVYVIHHALPRTATGKLQRWNLEKEIRHDHS